jgi:hypothetical protein
MNDRPKTTIALVVCILAWAINSGLTTRTGERLLSATIRMGFELLDGDDMLVGIG